MKLETEFRDFINEIIGGKYIGKLKVECITNSGVEFWTLCLYLDTEESPLILGYEGTKEQFKKFVKKEIKARKLEFISYWTAVQTSLDEEDDE